MSFLALSGSPAARLERYAGPEIISPTPHRQDAAHRSDYSENGHSRTVQSQRRYSKIRSAFKFSIFSTRQAALICYLASSC
jgi:hypothetical protein